MNTLITKALESKDIVLLLGFPEELLSKFERRVVAWIQSFSSRYGEPPELSTLQEEFETFLPVRSKNPLAYIYETTLTKKRNVYAREFMVGIQDELKKGADPLPYIQQLNQVLNQGSSGVTLYTKYDRTEYFRKRTSFPWGVKQLDRYTGGMAKGDLIYLIGRLGTGKTSLALYAVGKWLLAELRVLIVSNENRADDVVAKIDSYLGGFNPLNKRTGDWSEEDKQRVQTVGFLASVSKGEVVIPNKPVQSTAELQSLIQTYKPDVVLVDGIYLMQGSTGDAHWEKITDISRNLKRIAESEGVPILGLHQASRGAIGKKVDIETIAYSDALAQDADLVLAISKEEEMGEDVLCMECIKNRWGKDHWGFFYKIYFDTMTLKILDPKHAVITEEE